jgi:predicted kinase
MQTTQATNGSSGKRRMILAAVTKGRQVRPQRVVIYGPHGVGKSTFAADAPDPIFLPAEHGTDHLDIARFPLVTSWRDATDAIETLRTEEHAYRTAALDTIDALEPHVWAHTCATKRNGDKRAEHIEDYGFAKGYIYALEPWQSLLERLDALVDERGMNVVLIAHAQVSTFKSPDTEDFQRYSLKLHHKASALISEWADHVLFATHETLTHKQNNRAKGISTGNRLIYTERTAAYDAKNRGGLPSSLPLSWEAFFTALGGEAPEVWRDRIAALVERATPELAAKVTATVADAGEDSARLAKIHNRLSAVLKESGR